MNKDKLTTKLAAAEASLKRWQSRLKRAATMVHELDRKRRRYQLEMLSAGQPVIATVKVRKPVEFAEPLSVNLDEVQRHVDAAIVSTFTPEKIAAAAAIVHQKKERDIPDFLDRSDPLIAERMTAARKKAEAAERKKMPLSDKAARDYIKRKK